MLELFNSEQLLLISLFPIIGLVFSFFLTKKPILTIFIVFLILVLPAITGYDFILSWFYELCLTIILACGFYFIIKTTTPNLLGVLLSVLFSLLLLVVLVFNAYSNGFVGGQRVKGSWIDSNYKVEKVESYGFSGRSVYFYRLIDLKFFGLYLKEVDSKNSDVFRKENNFTSEFENEGVLFNSETNVISFKTDD